MITKKKNQFVIGKGLVVHKDRILLIKRERPYHIETHNKWELAGGKLEFNETIINCVKREVLEETGLEVKVIPEVLHIQNEYCHFITRTSQNVLICYICIPKDNKVIIKDKNVNNYTWLTLSQALKLNGCMSGTKEFLMAYKKRNK